MRLKVPCVNHESNRVPEMMLSYLQNMSFYYPSGKYKLAIHSFLEFYYTIVFVHDIVLLKRMFGAWYNVHKIFSALNLTIIFIKPSLSLEVTQSSSFSNEIYFSIKLFLLKTLTIIDWWVNDWLTQQTFISDISSQTHPSPVPLYVASHFILIFMFTF